MEILWAVILAFMISSNTAFTPSQLVSLYRNDFWDGTSITSGGITYEVKDGILLKDGRIFDEEQYLMDNSKNNKLCVVITTYNTKYGYGSWIADDKSNEIRFDSKGKNYKTIKIEVQSWGAYTRGKYIYVASGDTKYYRINAKTGKVKKY